MQEAIGAQYMQKHLPKLEPFLRRVVQEEVHNVLIRHIDSAHRIPLQLKTSSKRYKLQFQGNLPQTLFTGNRVEAENKQPLRIVLTDAVNNQLITSGPLSSMKMELLVLDGDFNADERLEHTEKEFSESIVFEREGKRPLLSGEVVIVLEKGVASVRDISFTDNSSWIRSRKFRLGARMSRASSIEERVQEAVSNPFLVKDHRGEVYKKHHPPALADDVWRLEKIGKDGVFHKKLADFGIHTVQDFLRNLVMDQYGLRGLLGSGMSNKMWESTVEHARECVLDDKLYSYCSGHGIILLFNCIHEIIGVVVGSNCFSLNSVALHAGAGGEVAARCLQVPRPYRGIQGAVAVRRPVADSAGAAGSSEHADPGPSSSRWSVFSHQVFVGWFRPKAVASHHLTLTFVSCV
ncbi:unnamed protein product [Triticum turgidum subsp. durum]|uniref:Uncharacterized protein n=1 Tax=Triticum turgidum subsp. durum TaxID=4567 RepID=A0A9R0T4X3_TRITD|nr:unnamed protein product [Triticum turgidum subsp. durum]